MDVLDYLAKSWLFWAILGVAVTAILGFTGILATIICRIFPGRTKLDKTTEERIDTIEREVKEVNESIKQIANHLDIPIYVDGLPTAPALVFVPFVKGLKLMAVNKWDEAIVEFKKALREATGDQKIALYSFLGVCYYAFGKIDFALETLNNSLTLARGFNNKEGKAVALSMLAVIFRNREEYDKSLKYYQDSLVIYREINDRKLEAAMIFSLGLVYQMKGVMDQAKKSYEEALKIFREIGEKEGEAKSLGNLGLVYQAIGNSDKALECYQQALKLNEEIGRKKGVAAQINNIGSVYEAKGEKEKALKYFEDTLKIIIQIGTQKEIEMVKENIRRLKGE